MYKVSVVIPVYNIEDYIVRCAESLFDQTLDDMQFIFVDDASSDSSVARLEQTLERFPQRKNQTIILHHAKNMGLPTARATGLAHVEAPYVVHCDGDDYVDPAMYARLYEKAVQFDLDMIVCGRKQHRVDGREISSSDRPNMKKSLIWNFLYGRLSAYVWCRLTKTDIYRQVQFPTGNYYEDWVQTAQLLTHVKRVFFLEEALYHYNVRPESITTDTRIDQIKQKVQNGLVNYRLMHDFIVNHYQVEEKDFVLRKMMVRCALLPQIKREDIRKQYLQTFPEINCKLLFDWTVPLQYKAFHLLILLRLYPFAMLLFSCTKRVSSIICGFFSSARTGFFIPATH